MTVRTILILAAAMLAGCASTGVTTRAVVEVQGSLEDAARYRDGKVKGDRDALENLSEALHAVGSLQTRLAIEKVTANDELLDELADVATALDAATEKVDGKELARLIRAAAAKAQAVSKAEAERLTGELSRDLLAAHRKLMQIREGQIANEVHYESMRAIVVSAVGLLAALAEREQSEQELTSKSQALIAAGAGAARTAAAGAAGGPAGVAVMGGPTR